MDWKAFAVVLLLGLLVSMIVIGVLVYMYRRLNRTHHQSKHEAFQNQRELGKRLQDAQRERLDFFLDCNRKHVALGECTERYDACAKDATKLMNLARSLTGRPPVTKEGQKQKKKDIARNIAFVNDILRGTSNRPWLYARD